MKREKRPLFQFDSNREEGYYSENGRIIGTYLHHLFHNDGWRHYWLNTIRQSVNLPQKPKVDVGVLKDERYERLAEEMGKHLDWEKVKKIISNWRSAHENRLKV